MSRRSRRDEELDTGASRGRRVGQLGWCSLLLTLLFPLAAYGQPIDFAAAFSPWPPPGWPGGASAEVRVTALGEGEELVELARFPVTEGRVHFVLEPATPRALEGLLAPFDPAAYALCDAALPAVSPGDARVAYALPLLYADGEPWGIVTSEGERSTGFLSFELTSFGGILYAEREARVAGGGSCPAEGGSEEVRYALELRGGPNLTVATASAGLSGVTTIVTTEPLLEGPLGVLPGTREQLVEALGF